jgi:hypothetical protein
MSWIQVTQTQTIEAGPPPVSVQYRLRVEVIAANSIEPELFVFDVTEDKYQHVAALNDLAIYPNNKAAALANDVMFYRASSMEYVASNQIQAAAAAQAIQVRLRLVNRGWGAVDTTAFGGVDTFVYDSAEP